MARSISTTVGEMPAADCSKRCRRKRNIATQKRYATLWSAGTPLTPPGLS